ncbi:MAG: DUF4878 domain-containing protein [Clostridia bacterium]|nr:DUF4878 domain-containing protein [Clostridia bacterium]
MDKKTKMIVYAVAAVILIILVVVCAAKIKASKPATALNNLVKELNNGNFKKAGEYCADNTMDLFGVDENIEDLEMVKLYYKNIDIKVNKVTKSKDTAVINVEISNKDLGKILNNYMNKAKELALENLNKKVTTKDMENQLLQYFKSQFEAEGIENVTTTVDVVLNKVDGKWKVVVDSNLRNAFLPGLYSLSNVFAG